MKPAELKQAIQILALRDDREAFRVFFDHYYARLIKFGLLFIPHQDQAEDIVSEVLIKILKQREKIFRMDNLEGYLFMSVKNQAISQVRKQKVRPTCQSIELAKDSVCSGPDPEKSLELDELSVIIEQAIYNLPPRRQMIFKLVREEKQKIADVAVLLDIAPKTVENHLDMAVKDLRKAISEYFEDQGVFVPIIKIAKFAGLLVMFLPLF